MATPTKLMAAVNIGHMTLLMQSDKAMKLVELMQHAVECDRCYSYPETYRVGEQPRVALTMLKPEQILLPEGAVEPMPARRARGPRLLK